MAKNAEFKAGDMVRIVGVYKDNNPGMFTVGEVVRLGSAYSREPESSTYGEGHHHCVFDADRPERFGCYASIERALPASPATPPDVAAPGDRLFDNGRCCLCGDGVPDWASDGDDDWYCTPCAERFGQPGSKESRSGAAREFARRRALQTPPAPEKWEPKVGEMCEGAGISTGFLCSGPFVRFVENTAILRNDGHSYLEWVVTRASLRPAPPSQSATAPKGEGERKAHGVEVNCDHCGARVPASAVSDGFCVACAPAGVPKHDPYLHDGNGRESGGVWAVTDLKNKHATKQRIAALSTGDELSQLAARRQRQRGALRLEMDRGDERRAEVKHPASWPEGAGEELYSTHGSGR